MAENTPTPSGQTPNQPNAPVVPAAATPVAAVATPPVTPATPAVTPAATPPVETPPAPTAAATPPAKPAETPPTPAVAPPSAAAIPEKYEFGPLENGQTINQAAIDAVTPALKAAGLTQEKASQLVTDFVKYQAGLPAAKNAADLEAIRKDPEIGMLNFGRTQATVNEALAAFTTAEERAELSKMGMASDPRLVRMFLRIGRAMSDAGNTPSDRRPVEVKTTAQRLYGPKPAAAS